MTDTFVKEIVDFIKSNAKMQEMVPLSPPRFDAKSGQSKVTFPNGQEATWEGQPDKWPREHPVYQKTREGELKLNDLGQPMPRVDSDNKPLVVKLWNPATYPYLQALWSQLGLYSPHMIDEYNMKSAKLLKEEEATRVRAAKAAKREKAKALHAPKVAKREQDEEAEFQRLLARREARELQQQANERLAAVAL